MQYFCNLSLGVYFNNSYLELIPLPDLGSIYCEEAYPLLFLYYKKD